MNDATSLSSAPQPAATATQREIVGKVASPPQKESTSEEFHFWIRDGILVERGQIVCTELLHGGQPIRFYALVREVYRQSRLSSLAEERDRYDGDTGYQPPHEVPGVMFAVATILRSVPEIACPPLDGSNVVLGNAEDAEMAFYADQMENRLAVGLIKNGARQTVGPGYVDLDYVLGANGGHVNVTGVAGRGTKSGFLLHMLYLLLATAMRLRQERPSDPDRLKVVPIILNVKNFDLFHLDRGSRGFSRPRSLEEWQALGIEDPGPFRDAKFFAPQKSRGTTPVDSGRDSSDVKAYSYSLGNVIEQGLFQYLFAAEDVNDVNFGTLVLAIEDWLTRSGRERDGEHQRQLRDSAPRTFEQLLQHVEDWADDAGSAPIRGNHHQATVRKFSRRLSRMIFEGQGALRREDENGAPLQIPKSETSAPLVIDLSSLARVPSLQRFVVATIFQQLVEERTGSRAVPGLVYLVTLDELNRFAPRGSKDPITKLVETVAAEMRSQGIILLGAQQQASLVSPRVIENAGLRVLGKTGSLELGEKVWSFLSPAARAKAMQLSAEEKLLIQDGFREPMLVKIPFPPWALRKQEALPPPRSSTAPTGNDFDAP